MMETPAKTKESETVRRAGIPSVKTAAGASKSCSRGPGIRRSRRVPAAMMTTAITSAK